MSSAFKTCNVFIDFHLKPSYDVGKSLTGFRILLLSMKYMWVVFALLAALTAGAVVVLTKAGLKDLDSSLAFA